MMERSIQLQGSCLTTSMIKPHYFFPFSIKGVSHTDKFNPKKLEELLLVAGITIRVVYIK